MTQPPLLDQWPLLSGLGVSLGLGVLMGVQRGWTLRREAAGSRFAGIRTFGLLGLSGGIAGAALALSGIADVDAAIITIGGLPSGLLDSRTAGLVVAAPVMANTLFKAGVAVAIVRTRRGWLAALPLVASVLAGGVMVALL